jgi:hypothetical protein
MHTVIRRYEGVEDSAELARRAVDEFGPQLQCQAGFQGYWFVDAGNGVVATISVFETAQQAADSTEAAAGWVADNLAELVPNPPQVTAGGTTGVSPGSSA